MNIAELGCGDARIICKLADKFSNHKFIGYEWDKFPYFLAKIRCKKRKNVSVYRQDFMKADYTKTNFAILFTGNEIAKELSQKLASEMPKGSIIISECFELPKLKCINEVNTDKKNYFFLPAKIFIYTIE
ncbi:MAG: class I SAM-dependent methyltransferase [Alphaproteobacteria bacterium]|nr:class I SAM-dependent methyltransferase [Alphaproteobacteria bacterium]